MDESKTDPAMIVEMLNRPVTGSARPCPLAPPAETHKQHKPKVAAPPEESE